MLDADSLQNIEFQSNMLPDSDELVSLFNGTSWASERDTSGVRRLIDHLGSDFVTARDSSGLVGFGRVLHDGVYRGWLDDVVVREDHRRSGIGSEIVRKLLHRVSHVEEIWLGCTEEEVEFYKRFGFRRFDHPAMMVKSEDRTSVLPIAPQNVEIIGGGGKLSPEKVRELFNQAAWAQNRSVGDIESLLQSESGLMVSAFSGNQLVAIGRTVTDFVYRAIIADVIVDRGYQKRGIGNAIVVELLKGIEAVEEVWLGCGDELVDFYRKFGFAVVRYPVMKRASHEHT